MDDRIWKMGAALATAVAAVMAWHAIVPKLVGSTMKASEPSRVLVAPLQKLHVRVADALALRRLALLEVAPAPGSGELFAWSHSDVRHFWMLDAPHTLDMVFLSRLGVVRSVISRVLSCPHLPCPIYSGRAAFILELPAGDAELAGLRPDAVVQGLPAERHR